MRRTGDLWQRILDRENLRLAVFRALRGKRDCVDARDFVTHLESHLAKMAKQLRCGTFPVGRYHQFVVHDPKERIITAPCFAERVLHHAMINVCEEVNRGGSWNNTAANCRTANRNRNQPENRNNNLGFRVALVPSR